jgi:AcrR family transcriptional regulator
MPRAKSAEPKSAPKWRRCPDDRPEQIIGAALQVFGERGLANARLQDIAERAGVSKGTIYLYFPNKEELFREMIRRTALAAIERAEKVVMQGTPTEQVLAFTKGYWQLVRSPVFSAIHRLVLAELHQFPDLARFYGDEAVAPVQKIVAAIVRRGVDTGEFREIEPMVAARMLIALTVMNGAWRDEHNGIPLLANKTDAEVFRELAEYYIHSISAKDGAFAQADGAPADTLSFIR